MWLITLCRICLLRANPQDLPASTALTVLLVVVYGLTSALSAPERIPTERAWQAALIDVLLMAAFTQAILKWRRHPERARQTLAALTGCGMVMSIVAVTLLQLGGEVLDLYIWLASVVWLFSVYGHILRHALDISYAAGIAVTGVYFFLSVFITLPFLVPIQTT